MRLVFGSLSGPQKRFFRIALDDYEPVNFCLAIAMMPLQQKWATVVFSGAENTHSEPVAKRMNKFTILVLCYI